MSPAIAPYEHIVSRALEHTVNGVVVTDATRPGNPIVHVNSGFTRLTGYSAEEVVGRNCNFLQGPDRNQPEVSHLRAAIAAGEPVTVVIQNYRKDGTPFWNQVELSPVRDAATGAVTHFFALQTDVTLKRQAERANVLRALELERMFRGGPLGMIMLGDEGCVNLVTPATWRLLGIPAQPIQGLAPAQLLERLATALGRAGDVLPWPQGLQHVRWDVQRGGSEQSLDVSIFELGSLTRERIVVLRDVTQEEADQTTRSQFLATAAHELRTPMGSICGFTELLLMRSYSPERARPMLETILRNAMRLSALINDLLDLSQMDALGGQSFSSSPVGLREVMVKSLQVTQPANGERRIQTQLPDEGLQVLAHAQKLEQVFINLLSNAIKYSPDGGEVNFRAELDPAGREVHLHVSDQGIGLSPEHQARLFTRFFRANPSGPIPGTGLGLTIVKELVQRMGGRIRVSSALGQGSTFTISLQLSGAAS